MKRCVCNVLLWKDLYCLLVHLFIVIYFFYLFIFLFIPLIFFMSFVFNTLSTLENTTRTIVCNAIMNPY